MLNFSSIGIIYPSSFLWLFTIFIYISIYQSLWTFKAMSYSLHGIAVLLRRFCRSTSLSDIRALSSATFILSWCWLLQCHFLLESHLWSNIHCIDWFSFDLFILFFVLITFVCSQDRLPDIRISLWKDIYALHYLIFFSWFTLSKV